MKHAALSAISSPFPSPIFLDFQPFMQGNNVIVDANGGW